jgi:hypothetical protein
MSRSRKLPIFKEKGLKGIYHRIVKRGVRNYLKSNFLNMQDEDFDCVPPNFKSIISDYDYSDYTIDLYHKHKNWEDSLKNKLSGK